MYCNPTSTLTQRGHGILKNADIRDIMS